MHHWKGSSSIGVGEPTFRIGISKSGGIAILELVKARTQGRDTHKSKTRVKIRQI